MGVRRSVGERQADLLRRHPNAELRRDFTLLPRCARTWRRARRTRLSVFQLPSGRSDFVEVFGHQHDNASLFPAEVREGIVVAFAVDDIAAARAELAAAEVELIGGLVWASELFGDSSMEGFGWFFFRGPDRNVYVMQQDSRTDELVPDA